MMRHVSRVACATVRWEYCHRMSWCVQCGQGMGKQEGILHPYTQHDTSVWYGIRARNRLILIVGVMFRCTVAGTTFVCVRRCDGGLVHD